MPFIQVELDAFKRAGPAAALAGIPQAQLVGGLAMLWHWCWAEKTDRVTEGQVAGCFSADGPKVVRSLVVFGFLEPSGDAYRVRGSGRYLRLSSARAEGGKKGGQKTAASKKSLANLRRGQPLLRSLSEASPKPPEAPSEASPKLLGEFSEAPPKLLRSSPEAPPKLPRSSMEALPPSTEQRTAKKEEETTLSTSSTAGPPPEPFALRLPLNAVEGLGTTDPPPTDGLAPQVREVFVHWQGVMDKGRSRLDATRRGRVEARLRSGFTVDDLKLAVDGCRKTPHNMGENDRGEAFNDLELICRDSAHVERFMANARAPPVRGATKGRASEADKDWTNYVPNAGNF